MDSVNAGTETVTDEMREPGLDERVPATPEAGFDTAASRPTQPTEAAQPTELERRLEAILMVADEPQGVVSLATALSAPVKTVHQAIDALVADFDGVNGTTRRGFELREVGGGWRIYVRP